MKLVEILAQEMEEWPETTHCYTQDSTGIVYPWREAPSFGRKLWLDGDLDLSETALIYHANLASDYRTAIVTKGMWLDEKNKLHKGVNTEWRERVVLPPVGVECGYLAVWPSIWVDVKVLAHTDIEGEDVAVVQCGNTLAFGGAEMFRKLDTKKQERENYIDRIYGVMCKAERPNNRSDMAEALYDAGLRFVEE